jgi:hypothetical protein
MGIGTGNESPRRDDDSNHAAVATVVNGRLDGSRAHRHNDEVDTAIDISQ